MTARTDVESCLMASHPRGARVCGRPRANGSLVRGEVVQFTRVVLGSAVVAAVAPGLGGRRPWLDIDALAGQGTLRTLGCDVFRHGVPPCKTHVAHSTFAKTLEWQVPISAEGLASKCAFHLSRTYGLYARAGRRLAGGLAFRHVLRRHIRNSHPAWRHHRILGYRCLDHEALAFVTMDRIRLVPRSG